MRAPISSRALLRERPGNVVVFSGRNHGKIGQIVASVKAGLHVLADKPWILKSDDLPMLAAALADADARSVVAYDIMTERFEATNSLQRELVNDKATFGDIVEGTAEEPAVYMESVHYLKKVVAGAPNIRPPWFFDTTEQGEGFNDIGTHLVDLVQWTLFRDARSTRPPIIRVLSAQRWPTWISERDSEASPMRGDSRRAFSRLSKTEGSSTTAIRSCRIRCGGIHAKLNVIWDWEPPSAGDTHFASYR